MPNVDVAIQEVGDAGMVPAYAGSLSTGDVYRIPNTGDTLIHLKKSGAGACTVTFRTPRQVSGLEVAEHTGTVPATTGDRIWSSFDPATFNVPGTGYMEITFSEITGLTMAALRAERL